MIFKKKQKLTIADMQNRLREFMLDTQHPHAHHMSELLGCVLISDEIAEKEEEESNKRVSVVAPLLPVLFAYSKIFSDAMIRHQRSHINDEDDVDFISEEEWTETEGVFAQIAISTLIGSMSQLLDMGFIKLTPKKVRLK